MSAIGGIFNVDHTPVAPADLRSMEQQMSRRGTDRSKLWHNNQIGLVSCLLQTTPESVFENLPLEADGLVLTADARLDNREELARLFELSEVAHMPDSAFILMAYQRWGEACVAHLIGDFSFAIWDSRDGKLFCARDQMGIKPFYYHWSRGAFSFASEMKALLGSPNVSHQINETKLVNLLLWQYHDKSATFYDEILRLPPAHTLVVSERGLHISRYWELDNSKELKLASEQEYTEQFLSLFKQAVECRTRSITPVGSMLSGGLDSSSVTCVARDYLVRQHASPLHTFSAIYPSLPQVDERSYIDSVVNQGNVIPYYLDADKHSFFESLRSQDLEEPHPFPNLHMLADFLSVASGQGIRVMLDGNDGDAVVSHGTGVLREMAYRGDWKSFADLCAALSKMYSSHGNATQTYIQRYGYPVLARQVSEGRLDKAFNGIQQMGSRFQISRSRLIREAIWQPLCLNRIDHWRHPQQIPSQVEKLLRPELAQRIDFKKRREMLEKNSIASARSARQEQIRVLDTCWLTEANDTLDRLGASFGVEMRHPFYDKRLVEFCVALPIEQKINLQWTRLIMRRAMQDILPPQIQWRGGKSNLLPNFKQALLQHEQKYLDQAILEHPEPLAPYLDIAAVQAVYQRFQKEQATSDSTLLWSIAMLNHWLEKSS